MPITPSDEEFTLMITNPDAYPARLDGLASTAERLNASAVHVGALGLRRKARQLASRGRRVASKAGRRAFTAARHAHPMALAATTARFTAKGIAAATAPVRRRIFNAFFGKLLQRRARMLAWSRRRTLVPTGADAAEARRWAVAYVKRRGVFGKMLGTALSGDLIGEPASSALMTASVPVLLALAKRALKAAERHGAPADPRQHDGESPDRAEGPAESDE
jgi:hypothetical protein